jgi:hypothetical protein
MQFEFSDIKQGECILIPGDDVELERLVETVGLPGYMDGHLSWIRKTYAGQFVCRICALFTSLLTIPQ